jgi:hypothetical protein
MKFSDFIKKTGFAPTYAAHSLLYKPKSRPVLMANSLGYEPSELDFMNMRRLISGKKQLADVFPEIQKIS